MLLILAGVTIAMLSGDNSAPQKATEAAQKDAIAGAKDEIAMEVQEALLNYYNNTYVKGNGTNGANTQSEVAKAAGRAVNSAKNKNKQLLDSSTVDGNTITLNTKSYTVTGTIDENGGITWSDYVESIGSTGSETEVVPKVGDTVNYSPSGSYTWDKSLAESEDTIVGSGIETLSSAEGGSYRITQWKILSYDPDSKMVEMVPTEPVGNLKLWGAQGYNNAVYLLNNACKNLYGNEEKGIVARSIKEEDFVNAGGEEWTSRRANYKEDIKYGEQRNDAYTSNKCYPSIYEQEKKSVIDEYTNEASEALNQSEQKEAIKATDNGTRYGYKEAGTSIKPYQTYYYTDDDEGTQKWLGNTTAGKLLQNENFENGYWVATRCINASYGGCSFEVMMMYDYYLSPIQLFYSHSGDGLGSGSHPLFPVVSLNSELLVKSEEPNTYDVKID